MCGGKETDCQHGSLLEKSKSLVVLANAYFGSCVLFTACELDLFTAIHRSSGPSCADLASRLSCDAAMIGRLCNACAALGLLLKKADRFYLTESSELFLVRDLPGNLVAALAYNRDIYPAWGKLTECVRTGKPVEKPELHLGEDPVRTRNFVEAMYGRAMAIGRAVAHQLDMPTGAQVLDVGGGSGAFASLIVQQHPGVVCRVIDLPAIVGIARQLVGPQFKDRVIFTEGDYHSTDFPAGNDWVLFFGVLHQEPPQEIRMLLKKAFLSLRNGGRIAVLDMFTDATRAAPLFSTLFSLTMSLTKDNGWVFSDEDLRGWCAEAGFSGYSVRPVGGSMPHWIAMAQKP